MGIPLPLNETCKYIPRGGTHQTEKGGGFERKLCLVRGLRETSPFTLSGEIHTDGR